MNTLPDGILTENQVAEVQINFSNKIKIQDRIFVKSNELAVNLFKITWDGSKIELIETFKIMLLNRNSQLLGIATISEGGMTTCLVDIRIIFSIALKTAATAIILAHNHPSGNLKASKQDIELTHQIVEAGKLLEIEVLEHLIITKGGFTTLIG